MKVERSPGKIILVLIILFATMIIYSIMLYGSHTAYIKEVEMLLFCNIFMCVILGIIILNNEFSVFEPILFVWFLYYMIFVFEPIRNIAINNVTEFGVNTMGGCIKATWIFMISFVILLLGYSTMSYKSTNSSVFEIEPKTPYDIHKLLKYSWIMWGVGIVAFLLYNTAVGRSPIYMLTFGLVGNVSKGSGYSVQILSTIIYVSFVPLLNILKYDRSRLKKIAAFLITCSPLATRGFRNVLTVVCSAPLVFYFTKRKKEPPLYIMLIGLLTFVFIFGFLAETRSATRTGADIDLSGYEYSNGVDGILYYFDSYKVFYGAVEQYPTNYPYTNGVQLLYTFTMFIPRIIWPGKPDTPIREVLSNSVGPLTASGGSTWPNIGEYYTDLGILGTLFIMFILGALLKRMKGMYDGYKATEQSVMLYSFYLPALVTMIAYGYTAGNLPQYIIMAFPCILMKYVLPRNQTVNK